jgi:two-component system sensor histidine kinase HydH
VTGESIVHSHRHRALRALVIAAGIAATVASAFTFHLADWPIYLAFIALSFLVFPFEVQVATGLGLPMPALALTIGFFYIAGPPVILLRNVAPTFLAQMLRFSLPDRWRVRLSHSLLVHGGFSSPAARIEGVGRAVVAADWSTLTLGLAARWLVVWLLAPDGRPAQHPLVMLAAEFGGYVSWAIISALPILSFAWRPVSRRDRDPYRVIYQDLGLIMILALTPSVFLISYGYQAHGLPGAVAWSLASLTLHFILQRLNQRRVTVEAQNQQLATLNRELEHRERLSAIGKMSSVVSHQILQQLGVIGIYADLIRNADETGEPSAARASARTNAAAIEDALRSVNRVLTDLLVFSRDLRLNLYEHPLRRVVEECGEECSADANQRGVALRVDCPVEVTVTVDKLKLKQALANAVRNAIEASPRGGEVTIAAGLVNGGVEIAVADRGPGVATADREAIFTPFFTTKEQGTGLGLAIAREFVEAHGGRLWVEANGRGSGARFVFRLPLRPA